jgi:cytochrome c1
MPPTSPDHCRTHEELLDGRVARASRGHHRQRAAGRVVQAGDDVSRDPIRRGFAVFSASCLPCHTLNLMGDARVGLDLNVPFSPTEYMREDFLRMQVRNPQALCSWPGAKMPGFGVNAISDRELDDLLAYLYYMAKRKVEAPKG